MTRPRLQIHRPLISLPYSGNMEIAIWQKQILQILFRNCQNLTGRLYLATVKTSFVNFSMSNSKYPFVLLCWKYRLKGQVVKIKSYYKCLAQSRGLKYTDKLCTLYTDSQDFCYVRIKKCPVKKAFLTFQCHRNGGNMKILVLEVRQSHQRKQLLVQLPPIPYTVFFFNPLCPREPILFFF